MKKMKTIFFALGLIVLATGAVAFTASKNTIGDDDKKCSIKIVKIVDGVKTVTDSTFDCSDELKWTSSLKGMEGSLEEMVEKMVSGLDSSAIINLDIDINDENGVKIFKLKGDDGKEMEMNFDFKISEEEGAMKIMFNGEEIEIKMDDFKNQMEKLSEEIKSNHGDMDFDFKVSEDNGVMKMVVDGEEIEIKVDELKNKMEKLSEQIKLKHGEEGDMEFTIINEEDGEGPHAIKIIKRVDNDGKVILRKIVDGEEVEELELGEDFMGMGGDHKFMIVTDEDGVESEVRININVNDEGRKEEKKIVIITKIRTDKAEDEIKEFPEIKENLNKKELAIKRLKFSPNPNDGKFDLSFKLEDKKPVQIKIVDMQGREVYNDISSDFSGRYSKNIDISENGEGIYLLQILQGGKASTSKIVIR